MYHRFTLDEGDRIVAMILSRVRYKYSFTVKLISRFLHFYSGIQESAETRDSHQRSQDTEDSPIRMQYLNNQVGVEAWMQGETTNPMFNKNFQRLQKTRSRGMGIFGFFFL